MTQSENMSSNSETNSQIDLSAKVPLIDLRFEICFTVLSGNECTDICSPYDGFANILLIEGSGTSTYIIQNNSYIIRSGENIIHPIAKHQVFEWKNLSDDNVAILLFIPLDILEEFKIKFEQQSNRFEDGYMTKTDSRLSLLTKQIIDLFQQDTHFNKLRIQSLLIEALLHQIEGLYAENEKHEIIVNKSHYDKIMLAKKIIEQNISRNFTISELAKEIGTNEQYLKKYFKQYFGKTVMNYITDIKMEHAKSLIMTGDYRVSDVARLTGYKHATHFTTAFKKYFGFIPNSLRYTFLIAHEGAKIMSEVEGFIGIL